MSIPGSGSPLLFSADAAAAAGYEIERSLRFNSADSAYLNRTPGSAGNRRTWTFSFWAKLTGPYDGTDDYLFRAYGSGSSQLDYFDLRWQSITGNFYIGGYSTAWRATTALFRDPSAWYHIVLAWDTTQSTAADRIKLYVNGVQQTAFSSSSDPSLNDETSVNNTVQHVIGVTSNFLLADCYLIDGQALAATDFGEFDATTGVWNPIAYSGSYGTNGFHLDFSDNSSASALGTDSSGNSNDWTVNNIVVTDGNSTIATATGALPILNTDSTGATVQSGLRSDSNASSLKLAVVGGTASGLDLSDQAVSGRSTSNASITNDGVTGTTSTSKFYSGSATVANGNNFEIAPHGDFELGGTFTIEFWAKPDSSATGNEKTIIGYGINASNGYVIMIGTQGAIFRSNGTSDLSYTRGSSTEWAHYAFVASGGNSRKIFVNGSLVASDSGTIDATGSYTTYIGSPDVFVSSFRFVGQFQDVRFYKGLAKYSSDFVVPNTYYPSIAAGNDSLFDSPTNGTQTDTGAGGEVSGNYCTWNPLRQRGSNTVSNGNLDVTLAAAAAASSTATFAPSTGKWYWEITHNGFSSTNSLLVGIIGANRSQSAMNLYGTASVGYYAVNGRVYVDGADSAYGASFTTGDVIGVALDLDSGTKTITFYKNGSSQGSINVPSSDSVWSPAVTNGTASSTQSAIANFGQRAFAYQNVGVDRPSADFKALCTGNFDTPTIEDPSTVMDVLTWTGDGSSTRTLTGLGFNPDLAWLKSRSVNNDHNLFDSVRGVEKTLSSNLTAAEVNQPIHGYVTAFNSDGFSVAGGSLGDVNYSSRTYVGWTWDAGTSTASNTSGTITSQVRANISAGFSIVSYTGTGAAATVGHGLGVKPEFIFTHSRSNVGQWPVYHSAYGATKYQYLNSTIEARTYSQFWNDTEPTSSVFSIGNDTDVSRNGGTHIAYCFAPVESYSAFGSYTGNGSSSSPPFIFTSFRPRWVLIKSSSNAVDWIVLDTARSTYNGMRDTLYPNLSDAEYSSYEMLDVYSNGFAPRAAFTNINASGYTYIYAAFAESPFKYARAR